MTRPSRLVPVAAALAASLGLACASAPARAAAPAAASARPAPGSTGLVLGDGATVYEHARVCVDRRHVARCGPRDASVFTGADGRFALRTSGPLVAEVGTDAWRVDPATGARTPVTRRLTLRAPAVDAASSRERAIGPLSTELQALVEAAPAERGRDAVARAAHVLASRLGLPGIDPALADLPDDVSLDQLQGAFDEQAAVLGRIEAAVAEAGAHGDLVAALDNRLALDAIRNIVVLYAENRSFNNVFAHFPGAQGVAGGAVAPQKDRSGAVLDKLPPAWGGLTAAGQAVAITQAETTNVLPNAPFQIDSPTPAWGSPAVTNEVVTRDLYHRFYENQMQIDGGANDQFAAWADSGGLVMGYYDGRRTALWNIARQYTLADHFFQGAFGGSFLNHQYLVCACAPDYDDADTSPAHPTIAVLRDGAEADAPRLALAPNSPPSALEGPPVFVLSGNLTPKNALGDGTFHAVNTMQPAYQPSFNPPAAGDAGGRYADPLAPTTLPPQTRATIGDRLNQKHVAWTWYSGGWNDAVADRTRVYDDTRGGFQSHHQPFNFYAAFDPATQADARAAHLKDEADLLADVAAGRLPPVAFYKPVGTYNEHPGATSLALGDAHLAGIIAALQRSPQWAHMLVVVTYDENGGQWDEVAPPRGDRVGPGTRIPAVVISPFARRGYVDHTPYDTGSVLRLISHRFALPLLDGLRLRDASLVAHGHPAMGDLTGALDFGLHRQAAR